MQATPVSRPPARPARTVVPPADARTLREAGVDVSRSSANAAEIATAAVPERSPLAAVIGIWETHAAALRPVALEVGPWLPPAAARDAASTSMAAMLAGVFEAVISRFTVAWRRRQQRRAALRDIEILRQLDDATLRDIGVMRDDIPAAAYERARRLGG